MPARYAAGTLLVIFLGLPDRIAGSPNATHCAITANT
jgi:hypothetical protein